MVRYNLCIQKLYRLWLLIVQIAVLASSTYHKYIPVLTIAECEPLRSLLFV